MSYESDSDLSEHGSEEFQEDVKLEQTSDMEDDADLPSMPPAKKQKLGRGHYKATPEPLIDYDDDISSDTSGEAPSSPGGPTNGEDDADQQVTICRWRGCTAGDCGNMDELVKHIHDVHVLHRQKKYACEWEGCGRIDATHASGYALRAHMRSHTREKPFYCALPECDKAFTRSDALAKHMRTVHETESLRPSDPVPRNHSYNTNPLKQKLKLVLKPQPTETDGPVSPVEVVEAPSGPFPAEFDLTEEEQSLPPDQQYKLWRRKVHWAEQEGIRLKSDCEKLEKQRKDEWLAKELLLTNLIEADLAVEVTDSGENQEVISNAIRIKDAMLPTEMLPMHGDIQPFYRQMGDNMSVTSLDAVEAGHVASAPEAAAAVQENGSVPQQG